MAVFDILGEPFLQLIRPTVSFLKQRITTCVVVLKAADL